MLEGHGLLLRNMKDDQDVDGTPEEFNNGVVNGGPFIAPIKLSRFYTFIERIGKRSCTRSRRKRRRKLYITQLGEIDSQRARERDREFEPSHTCRCVKNFRLGDRNSLKCQLYCCSSCCSSI